MAVVTGHNLAKSFGAEDIFSGITVSIPQGARIAMVGPNGSGKTTLLNLLARRDDPTEGTVSHAKSIRIGILPQEADLALVTDRTLWDEMLLAFADLLAQEERLNQLADALANSPDNPELLDAFGAAQMRFETASGYTYTTRINQVLGGLGFEREEFPQPVNQLSGGQKTRALLARLLLESPDLLILDEPTNHLDLQAIEWLEKWLKTFEGALLIVSHDRYFMDAVATRIWELTHGHLLEYSGNYSHYTQQREERWARANALFEQEKERLLKEVDFIKRNMAAQATAQAKGRLKRLTRQLVAIEEVGLVNALSAANWSSLGISVERPFSIEEAERRVRALRKPVQPLQTLNLRLRARQRSGDKVLMTDGLTVGYPDANAPLFQAPDITLYRGECAALIGPNGTGKTTLLKTILGRLEALGGEVRIGASVEIGYFAQAHEELNPDRTIIEEIQAVQYMEEGEARSYLAQFLFTDADGFKPISLLSGGERGRVALAKLSLSGANLLLLDEPTNHLDIPSQEILEAVLAEFTGTILLVSHDRYLIRNLATQVWALHTLDTSRTGQTELVVFEGPYDEYLAWREGRQTVSAAERKKGKTARKPEPSPVPQLNPYQRRKRLAQVEADIHRLEVELVNISGALESSSASGDVGEVTRLGAAYMHTEKAIEDLMGEWEKLHFE
nr:ABC-F family ATP-binding cassette domain-containing protein [Anaerolineae bacterium]